MDTDLRNILFMLLPWFIHVGGLVLCAVISVGSHVRDIHINPVFEEALMGILPVGIPAILSLWLIISNVKLLMAKQNKVLPMLGLLSGIGFLIWLVLLFWLGSLGLSV